MAWFRCFIRGENFPAGAGDADQTVGFFTTRFVEADGEDAAEEQALEALLADPWLASLHGHPTLAKATLFVQEAYEVSADTVPAVPPGFTFFRPGDDAAAD